MIELKFLKNLREKIYNAFPIRRDANMNLLDALSSYGHRAKSVVELSESPYFERQYSSITDGIADGLHAAKWQEVRQTIYEAEKNHGDRFIVITDCTPQSGVVWKNPQNWPVFDKLAISERSESV